MAEQLVCPGCGEDDSIEPDDDGAFLWCSQCGSIVGWQADGDTDDDYELALEDLEFLRARLVPMFETVELPPSGLENLDPPPIAPPLKEPSR